MNKFQTYFILTLLLLNSKFSISQSNLFFTRLGSTGPDNSGCFDDHGDIIYLEDDDIIVTGTIGETPTNRDILLARLNESGDTLWSRKIGNLNESEFGRALAPVGESDFVLIAEGYFSNCMTSNALIKFNSNGNIIGWKTLIAPGQVNGIDIIQTMDGNILALFSYYASSDIFISNFGQLLIKFDPNGNIIWDKGYYIDWQNLTPGSLSENHDGSIICSGTYGNSSDQYMIKTDANGNLISSIYFNSAGTQEGYNVYNYPDGSFLILGRYLETNYKDRTALYKFNPNGQFEWMKKIQLLDQTRPAAMCGNDYRVFIGGSSTNSLNNQVYLMEVDSSGQVIWANVYPNIVGGLNECVCTDTEIVSSGFYESGSNYHDALILKTDALGTSCNNVAVTDLLFTTSISITNLPLNTESGISATGSCSEQVRSGIWHSQICYTLGIEEENDLLKKTPVKIIDLLGREVNFKTNTTLIYIYSDGTTEKVYVTE